MNVIITANGSKIENENFFLHKSRISISKLEFSTFYSLHIPSIRIKIILFVNILKYF